MDIGINTNNECGKNDIKILNNIKKSGFKMDFLNEAYKRAEKLASMIK